MGFESVALVFMEYACGFMNIQGEEVANGAPYSTSLKKGLNTEMPNTWIRNKGGCDDITIAEHNLLACGPRPVVHTRKDLQLSVVVLGERQQELNKH